MEKYKEIGELIDKEPQKGKKTQAHIKTLLKSELMFILVSL